LKHRREEAGKKIPYVGGLSRYKIGHVGASFTNIHPISLWESKRVMEIDYQKMEVDSWGHHRNMGIFQPLLMTRPKTTAISA